MDEGLKQVLGHTSSFLDFHSVVDGFRPVGLIGLIEPFQAFNQFAGTGIPSLEKQLETINDYLKNNAPGYEFIPGWGNIYFVNDKSKRGDIARLLMEHPFPVGSKEGGKKLGLLLSFPKCCVMAHANDEDIGRYEEFYILPFAPCSSDCEAPWMAKYLQLAEKYNIDPKRIYINGNE